MHQGKEESSGEIPHMQDSGSNRLRHFKAEDLGFILVVFIPLVALCIYAGTQVFRNMLADAHWVAVIFFLGPLLLPPVLYVARAQTVFVVATAVLIPLEVLATFLAQYTLIGVSGMTVIFLLWANLIPIALQSLNWKVAQFASWILLALITLSILLPQALLGVRLLRLNSEAKRMVAYSYDYKLRTGTFPADLSAYPFRHPKLREHFTYYGHGIDDKFTYPFKGGPHYDQSDKFSLRYYVGNSDTAYWFSSQRGWFVEDD